MSARHPEGTTRRALILGAAGLAVAACTPGRDGGSPTPSGGSGQQTPDQPVAVPTAGLGPITADLEPGMTPAQAGPLLVGTRLPTNQWWTSALTGPWSQAMWAMPIVAKAGPGGLGLAVPATLNVAPNAVTADPTPQLTVGGALSGIQVTGYGDFSVQLALQRTGAGPISAMLAQGTPLVHLSVPAGAFSLDVPNGTVAAGPDGSLTIQTPGRSWQVLVTGGADWEVNGSRAVTQVGATTAMIVAARPTDARAGFDAALAAAGRAPITGTRSTLTLDRGARLVRQQLTWSGNASGLVVTMPHQRIQGRQRGPVLGTFPTAGGTLEVIAASALTVTTPLVEPRVAVPEVNLDGADTAAMKADLEADLTHAAGGAGIYDDGKALGRLAILADIVDRLHGAEGDPRALDLLAAGLADWLTHSSTADTRWLAYEPTWGGIAAHPAQFGSQDYNDHHFQFAYLIRAAATLQRLARGGDRALTSEQSQVVDLLVDDVLGVSGSDRFPPFRVWNAYLGHSAASGFAPFPDGNNQESSSEAVQAWEAIAAWGKVTGAAELVDAGIARYSMETLAARTYWLGETITRPAGYDHDVAGIVWNGKIDFATFFDGRPEAVIGIQLLPFTPGSTYRSDRTFAARRVADARAAGGGTARLWPDLFVMEQAVADPAGARAELGSVKSIEAGNSRAWLRWWVLAHQP